MEITSFCDEICTSLENEPVNGVYDDEQVLMWDGLNVHKTGLVMQTIQARPSHNVFHTVTRPPYRPKIAPIEYVFCELAYELNTVVKRDWTTVELVIYDIVGHICIKGTFMNTFIHCGYPIN